MKKQTDKTDDKKKLAEKAVQRWENEGGEVLEIVSLNTEIALEKRHSAENENPRTGEANDGSFERQIIPKVP